jgi:hypothetical protein
MLAMNIDVCICKNREFKARDFKMAHMPEE